MAVIDVSGNLLELVAKKVFKKSEIVSHLTEKWHPLLIASDVEKTPKLVKSVAKSLGCKYFSPERTLSVEEKSKLVKEFEELIHNVHERDALAAVLKAYKTLRPLLKKIEHELRSLGMEEEFEEVAAKVISGECENIKDAIEKVRMEKRGG